MSEPVRSKGLKGVRLNPANSERQRAKIRTTQLCKRLEGFALSEEDPQTKKPIEMSPAQVNAALGLLKKTLPDLTSVEGNFGLDITMHEKALDELE